MFTIFKVINNTTNNKKKDDEISPMENNFEMTSLEDFKSIKDAIKEFRDKKVYVTKKTRINSEARMNANNFHSIIILNLYTFILLCYSIISLKNSDSEEWLSIMSLVVSIGVFGASLFVSLYGFREKALAYKMSHLEIAKIESKLELLLLDRTKDERELLKLFEECYVEYNDVIGKTENHHNIDYITFKYYNKDPGFKYQFYKYKTLSFLLKSFLYALPFLGWIYYFL